MSRKTSTNRLKPDADLAAWCAALASPMAEDTVPPGWFTTKQLAERLGKSRPNTARLLSIAVDAGRCQMKMFRVCVGTYTRATPHYRLK